MAWWNSWQYAQRYKITVPSGTVSTLSYFPVFLASLANDGRSDWGDLAIASDLGLGDATTSIGDRLPLEVVAGRSEAHFQLPAVSASGTLSYFWALWGGTQTSQPAANSTYGSQKVWREGASQTLGTVLHLGEGTNGPWLDSTENGNNSIGRGGGGVYDLTQVTGKVGKGVHFPSRGGSGYGIDFAITSSLCPPAGSWDYTISAWYKNDAAAYPAGDSTLFGNWPGQYMIYLPATANGKISLYRDSSRLESDAGAFPADGAWHRVDGVKSGSNGTIYVDGVAVKSGPLYGTTFNVDTVYRPGICTYNNLQRGYLIGTFDEIRFAVAARSASWVAAEFANQNLPGTFITPQSGVIAITTPRAARLRRSARLFGSGLGAA